MKRFLQRHKYTFNALLLLLPIGFYNGWFSSYPKSWEAKQIGEFTVKALPLNLDPPYIHDGSYAKDFMILFREGEVANIRQAYLNIGPQAIPLNQLQQSDEGLLHGSPRAQTAHAISQVKFSPEDKLWLTIEDWQMQQQVISWDLPAGFI